MLIIIMWKFIQMRKLSLNPALLILTIKAFFIHSPQIRNSRRIHVSIPVPIPIMVFGKTFIAFYSISLCLIHLWLSILPLSVKTQQFSLEQRQKKMCNHDFTYMKTTIECQVNIANQKRFMYGRGEAIENNSLNGSFDVVYYSIRLSSNLYLPGFSMSKYCFSFFLLNLVL